MSGQPKLKVLILFISLHYPLQFLHFSWFLITWTIQHLKQLHRSDSLQSLNAPSELDWIDLINKSFNYFCQTNGPMTAAHRLVWKLKGFWLDDSIHIHKPARSPQCPNDLPETPDFLGIILEPSMRVMFYTWTLKDESDNSQWTLTFKNHHVPIFYSQELTQLQTDGRTGRRTAWWMDGQMDGYFIVRTWLKPCFYHLLWNAKEIQSNSLLTVVVFPDC